MSDPVSLLGTAYRDRIAASVHGGLAGVAARYARPPSTIWTSCCGWTRPGPAAAPLAEVRRVLEGLLGRPLVAGRDDVTAARRGTGREALSAADRAELGSAAADFPLFG
jgi:hypothetical protein